MQRPTAFRLGSALWTLEWVSKEDLGHFGETCFDDRKVKIAGDLPRAEVLDTFFHEVQHVIHDYFLPPAGPDFSFPAGVTEEAVATAAGHGWSLFWMQNTKLLPWLRHELAQISKRPAE